MNDSTTLIYYADTAPLHSEGLFEAVYGSVSEERRKKTDRMRFIKDKCLSLGVEYLLMRACRDFGVYYEKESIITGDHSKPAFVHSPVHFNLSHSGDRVMCIMSEHPVGCDVETVHKIDMKIAEKFFFEDEYRTLEACSSQEEREDMFFRYWTLKESFMKCTGLGFALPLNEFSVSIKDDDIRISQSVDDGNYSLFEWNENDGYRYAWCVKDMPTEKIKLCDSIIHVDIQIDGM